MLISNGGLAPVGFADAAPTSHAYYYPQTMLQLAGQTATYGAIYKSQPWVAALVNKLAFNTARLPLKVYQRSATGREEARDTPFARLLRNPNPRHDPFFFWLWTSSTFEVYGEAIWVKLRPAPGDPPSQLWPLHPSNVFTKRDPDTGALVYVYHWGSAAVPVLEFDQGDIVHFRSYNPDDQVRGLSRLEPLRQTIIGEDAIRRAGTAMYSNGARPSVLLSKDGVLSQPAADRLKASWDAIHGGVDSWGKTAVLEEGLKPTIVQLNLEEMQFVEAKKLNREEACGVYDVPPPAVHILDRATFSNITEQMRSVYRDTMAPRLGLFESVIDSQLRPDFDPRGVVYAEFLMDEVLRGAFEQRATAYQQAINSGWLMPSEVRAMENQPFVEGSDRLFINSAAVPLEQVETVPPKALNLARACVGCATEGPLSKRDLCRSCEGKTSRVKEII